MNVGEFFGRYGKAYDERPAIVFGSRVQTYRATTERVFRLANAMRSLSVRPEMRVAMLADNCPEILEVFFARYVLGAVEITLNTKLTAPEWARQIEETKCEIVVGAAPLLAQLLPHLDPTLHRSIISVSGAVTGAASYEDVLSSSSSAKPDVDVDVSPARLGRVVYTGGTTGAPKGVMLSRSADLAQLRNILVDLAPDLDASSVFLGLQPMYHAVRPFFFPCWIRGATHVIVPDFQADTALDAVEAQRVTHVKTVPTVLVRMLADPRLSERDLRSLRTIFYGGSPMPVEKLREAIEHFGQIFVQNYGQTESAMTVCLLRKEDHQLDGEKSQRLGSIGRPYSWVEVKLVDQEGNAVQPGEVGELVVRGDHNMMGYLNRPAETAEALRDGWVYTRDIGTADDEGYIYLLDRKTDMIITGGENVYPGEVEQVIYRHPAVFEVCAFGIPDDQWGEAVTAAVTLKPGMTVDEAALIEFCKGELARYKCPKRIVFLDALPKGGTGKILRRELRAPWWREHERAIH
jgi:long-chain acyl-CoA synthetase